MNFNNRWVRAATVFVLVIVTSWRAYWLGYDSASRKAQNNEFEIKLAAEDKWFKEVLKRKELEEKLQKHENALPAIPKPNLD